METLSGTDGNIVRHYLESTAYEAPVVGLPGLWGGLNEVFQIRSTGIGCTLGCLGVLGCVDGSAKSAKERSRFSERP